MNTTEHKKLRLSIRYWLLAKAEENPDYYRVLKALEIAEKYHNDNRKDGKPTMTHQLSIMGFLKTLNAYLKFPVKTYIVALLHDTYEDYPESEEELSNEFPEEFEMIVRISKVRDGEKITYEQYFSEMQECPVCSIVKLADRISNVSTMVGVFNYQKQTKYLEEVNNWFLPMLKHAKRKFPEQTPAYENIKSMLTVQRDLILKVREEFIAQIKETGNFALASVLGIPDNEIGFKAQA